jgi:hypothetical protein
MDFLHALRSRRQSAAEKMEDLVAGIGNKKLGRTALLSAVVVGWNVYDMATETEAQSQAVNILQYLLLALAAVALVGSVSLLLLAKVEN